jgi:hypothetical protein
MDQPEMKHIARTALGKLCVVMGLICLAAAVLFGLVQTVRLSKPEIDAPSVTSAGASCGLAIAGSLCFVAAAIAEAAVRRPGGSNLSEPDTTPKPADK